MDYEGVSQAVRVFGRFPFAYPPHSPLVGRVVNLEGARLFFRRVLDNLAVLRSPLLGAGVLGRWGFLFLNQFGCVSLGLTFCYELAGQRWIEALGSPLVVLHFVILRFSLPFSDSRDLTLIGDFNCYVSSRFFWAAIWLVQLSLLEAPAVVRLRTPRRLRADRSLPGRLVLLEGRSTLSITRKKSQFSFKWFELGSNLLSINRREQTASPIYSIMAGLKTSEEDHHLYPAGELPLCELLTLSEPSTDRCANCTGHCAKWPLSQSVNGGTGALGISFLLAVGVINAIELRYSSSRSSLLSELPSLCSGLTFTNSFLSATNFKA
ncbi:hypothetical protein Sango_3077400 [Sesamum angolense]|uniref:Uncharacterized protein n=1 Tax=Sesamum angolense TaxID=2727404 RepID=A0AAE1T9Z1_9LAMI|nr:hypothetical protein Sango_3077400 [Sesamum angolense]